MILTTPNVRRWLSALVHLTRDGIEKGLAFVVTWTGLRRASCSKTNDPSTMRPFLSTSDIHQNRPSNFEHSTPNETGELLKELVKDWNILELQNPKSAGPLGSSQFFTCQSNWCHPKMSSAKSSGTSWFIISFPSKQLFGGVSPILATNLE